MLLQVPRVFTQMVPMSSVGKAIAGVGERGKAGSDRGSNYRGEEVLGKAMRRV